VRIQDSPDHHIRINHDSINHDLPFTALFAYNDISAIGSIRAFQAAGLRVPEDVSVVGFDDIQIALHNNPSLTTVRQPLQKMGEIAARTLLNRIEEHEDWVPEIAIEPEFLVRNSTARALVLSTSRKRELPVCD